MDGTKRLLLWPKGGGCFTGEDTGEDSDMQGREKKKKRKQNKETRRPALELADTKNLEVAARYG